MSTSETELHKIPRHCRIPGCRTRWEGWSFQPLPAGQATMPGVCAAHVQAYQESMQEFSRKGRPAVPAGTAPGKPGEDEELPLAQPSLPTGEDYDKWYR